MLTNLERLPNDARNAAGWRMLEYVIPPWVSALTIPMSGITTVAPTLGVGYGWKRIWFTNRTLEFGDEVKQTEHGQVHQVKIACFVPRTDTTALSVVNEMAAYEDFILRIQDNDGNSRLVGTLQEVLKFGYKEGNSGGPGTRKGIWLEFAGDFSRPALFLG